MSCVLFNIFNFGATIDYTTKIKESNLIFIILFLHELLSE